MNEGTQGLRPDQSYELRRVASAVFSGLVSSRRDGWFNPEAAASMLRSFVELAIGRNINPVSLLTSMLRRAGITCLPSPSPPPLVGRPAGWIIRFAWSGDLMTHRASGDVWVFATRAEASAISKSMRKRGRVTDVIPLRTPVAWEDLRTRRLP